jgi:hypothetical protein
LIPFSDEPPQAVRDALAAQDIQTLRGVVNALEKNLNYSHSQRMLLETENGEIRGKLHLAKQSLEELVTLKDYKDERGKDAGYYELQPIAWANARTILKELHK